MLAISHVLMLLLARGASSIPEHKHISSIDLFTSADYITFGAFESFNINALEARVLNFLCKHVILLTNSVQVDDGIDVRLQAMAVRNREIFVITSVLVAQNPIELLNQLLARSGYAAHYLLAKLFSPVYVEFLESNIKQTSEYAFTNCHKHLLHPNEHWRKLKQIYAVLQSKISCELTKTLIQYALAAPPNHFSFDYAIFTLAREKKLSRISSTEYKHLLEYWLYYDLDPRSWIPFVKDYLRVLLLPDVLPERKQSMLKKNLITFVASKDDKVYLELLDAFEGIWSIKTHVISYVNNLQGHSISPHFVLNYLSCPKMNWKGPYDDPSITSFWTAYLKTPAYFNGMENAWSENRLFFNKIGPVWLRNFFRVLLREGSKPQLNRDKIMDKYMNMLNLNTFLKILKSFPSNIHTTMLNFMLEYLGADSRKVYLSGMQEMMREKCSIDGMSIKRRNQIIRKLTYTTAQTQYNEYHMRQELSQRQGNKKIEGGSADLAQSTTARASTRIAMPINRKRKLPAECQEVIEIADDS
ncbi:hypothetical protein PAPHI01_0374 [Pancytospora philotis]|nr:hypothetical protein PAPHI01_0348 [Pancytospora philotis]KAI4291100.1 hypothetical protein PAPHI01_0374 [Pancytospora philotis]